jgi:hypothetical protein
MVVLVRHLRPHQDQDQDQEVLQSPRMDLHRMAELLKKENNRTKNNKTVANKKMELLKMEVHQLMMAKLL